MSFIISGQDAYDIYEHLGLRKAKKKSASYETVETILKSKNVEIKPKPSDPVSLNLKKTDQPTHSEAQQQQQYHSWSTAHVAQSTK